MKDYYKLFIDLSLQQCLKDDYTDKEKVKAHNKASKKMRQLQKEMKQNDCSDILCDLLEYQDDRVKVNAVFLCLQMDIHREKASQTAREIIVGSSDSTIIFSAKTALQNM